jgi:hypothetical protein
MPTVTCKLPHDLNNHLAALARRCHSTKSAVLRQALEQAIKNSKAAARSSAHSLLSHLCGALRGPHDLSTNRKHLKGFGE